MDATGERLLGVNTNRTGHTLRRLREAEGLTLRDLAGRLFCDHSWLGNIEKNRRWPADRSFAERADLALNGNGSLVAAWDADQRDRARTAETVKLLEQAQCDSEALLVAPDGVDLHTIGQAIHEIAIGARFEPYDQTLRKATKLRSELMRRVRQGAHRPEQIRDLYVALGRICGVLAYLTLDLGQADTAKVHAEAAFQLGDRADHNQLRAWSRGTQALALRFTKDFDAAARVATDGLRYVNGATGTSEPRLLCGLAASGANLGDSTRAVELLEQAERVREHCRPDEVPGLFSFSQAKQIYYQGFSLMWAEDPRILSRSVRSSEEALRAWQVQRSPGDEMLTTIYLASANARLGNLDESIAAVAPVLQQPISAHFSWVRKRLNQLDSLLAEHFPDSTAAVQQRQTLQAYIHAA